MEVGVELHPGLGSDIGSNDHIEPGAGLNEVFLSLVGDQDQVLVDHSDGGDIIGWVEDTLQELLGVLQVDSLAQVVILSKFS